MWFRTEEPDVSAIPDTCYDWEESVYIKFEELLPNDAPGPLGNNVVAISYRNSNMYHSTITVRLVTGVLYFSNKTSADWCSKKQATVKTADYESYHSFSRTCAEQIFYLRITLRHLGVPERKKICMLGNIKSAVDNIMIPPSKIHKMHTTLSFHRIIGTIVAGIIFY